MTKTTVYKRTTILAVAISVLILGLIIGTSVVNALEGEGGRGSGKENSTLSPEKKAELEKKKQEMLEKEKTQMEKRKSEIEVKKTELEAKHEENKEKLADKRLENCKKKETSINNSMKRIADRRAKQIEVFNKIAERTMAFYEEKGLTLANYDALVADVIAKKANAEAEIANLKASTVDFKCDSTDPLKVSDAFKQAREGVVTAMKEYKTAVKNLVVGVKSVASTEVKKDGEQ